MDKKLVFLFIFFLFVSNSYSMVANPFLRKVIQPDGSIVNVRYVGNEWNNYLIDEKGKILERNKNGYWIEKDDFLKKRSKKPSLPFYLTIKGCDKESIKLKDFILEKVRNNFEKRNNVIKGLLNEKKEWKSEANIHPVLVILV